MITRLNRTDVLGLALCGIIFLMGGFFFLIPFVADDISTFGAVMAVFSGMCIIIIGYIVFDVVWNERALH